MLPVLAGLVLISVVFTSLNPVFLAPINLANLLFDASAVGFIALGIIFVLLLGEIDLSVGSMSGLASAMIGVLWVKTGLPLPLAILGAMAAGAFAGLLFGLLRNRFEMPSFVVTLAGLLTLLGLQLYILGPTGSINLPFTSPLVRFGQLYDLACMAVLYVWQSCRDSCSSMAELLLRNAAMRRTFPPLI